MADVARAKRYVPPPSFRRTEAAPIRGYVPAPPVRIAQAAAFPVRNCSVWFVASAITAAAVAYATGSHRAGEALTAAVSYTPATTSVAETTPAVREVPSSPATYQVASAETRVYRRVEPSHNFADRWGQYEIGDPEEPIMTGAIRAVKTVRFAKPEPVEESIGATVTAYAPTGGFTLASADSHVIELGKPAAAPPAKIGKPEFDEVEDYLWEVYQRTPVKKDGAGDFTWKDPAAAKRMGVDMQKYVISGMDPDFREQLYHAGKAMDAGGVKWSILSAFRDDYRQTIASGIKASAKNSLHGGSRRTGGYGHGQAVDLTGTDGTDMGDVWDWIDDHGAKYGLHRPMPGYDPAHIQSRGDWHKLAKNLRAERVKVAQQREREEAAKAKVASAAAK
jgi:hypothetical protein